MNLRPFHLAALLLAPLLALLLMPTASAQAQAASQSAPASLFRLRADPSLLAPLTAQFTASASSGQTVSWDFGDGTRASGPQVSHTFYRPGQYTIRVTLSNSRGQVVGSGEARLQVKSAGAEHAAVTLLLAPGSLRISGVSSVIYAPGITRYWLDGKEIAVSKTGNPVKSEAVAVPDGPHRAAVQIESGGKTYRSEVSFTMAPLKTSAPFDLEVLRLTNLARAQGWNCQTLKTGGKSLPPLTRDPTLDAAAAAQSAGLALGGYFDHTSGLDGSSPAQRLKATGLQVSESGENIASGQDTPAEVVDGWLRSLHHCENIMRDFTHIGLSYISRPDSIQKTYWTQVFARP